MKTIHREIWDAALPFQDKRDDAGHAFITLEYAKQLTALEMGNPDIILPAIILHDTGWSRLKPKDWQVIFNTDATIEDKKRVRILHQIESANIAREILTNLNYHQEWVIEIVDIISEHDTRPYFASRNDGLVRDADKLWRFSRTGIEANLERYEFGPEALFGKLRAQMGAEDFFYSKSAHVLATQELERRKLEFSSSQDKTELITAA